MTIKVEFMQWGANAVLWCDWLRKWSKSRVSGLNEKGIVELLIWRFGEDEFVLVLKEENN